MSQKHQLCNGLIDPCEQFGSLTSVGYVIDATTNRKKVFCICLCGNSRILSTERLRVGCVNQCRMCSGYDNRASAENISITPKLIEKFEARVTRNINSCWDWVGSTDSDGYPKIYFEQHSFGAHRISWVIHRGQIQKGMHVLHECDNPRCTNPDHLFLGSHKRNMEDLFQKKLLRKMAGEQYRSQLKHPQKAA